MKHETSYGNRDIAKSCGIGSNRALLSVVAPHHQHG
ncbi:hypothetical protein DFAR_1310015 [Desulfarculales bacterium]